MPLEHWVLHLDLTLHALPWPFARPWASLTPGDLATLPHSVDDLLRTAPSDGFDRLVPTGLPREAARCTSRLAAYHDAEWLNFFIQADTPPAGAGPYELAELEREDFACILQLDGVDRGLYMGMNERGEHIAFGLSFDDSLNHSGQPRTWPWHGATRDKEGRLEGYEAKVIRTPTGMTAAFRVRRALVAPRGGHEQWRFTASRRCFRTNEICAWATAPNWTPRSDEMGTLVLADAPPVGSKPSVRRVDLLYDAGSQTGTFRVHWRDLLPETLMHELRRPPYGDYIGQFTLALNGLEQTGPLKPVTETTAAIPDGWNRLELLTGFAGPFTISFQKFAGDRVVPGLAARRGKGATPPTRAELREAFARWHAATERSYHGNGTWGSPAGPGGIFNISHNGAFYAENYALAILHLDDQPVYRERLREFCDRALAMQKPEGWFPDLAVNPAGDQAFAGGGFDTGGAGETVALGARVFNDPRCLASSRRIIEAYRLYPYEINQNYAAFAVWHLTSHYAVDPLAAALSRAVYYGRDAARAIDLAGAQDGHNYFSGYGGITLKGLAKLVAMLPDAHSERPWFADRVVRMCNQMISRQQETGFFAERNRKYVGYHSLSPAVGLIESALALGGPIAADLRPAILMAYEAQRERPDGGIVTRMARMM